MRYDRPCPCLKILNRTGADWPARTWEKTRQAVVHTLPLLPPHYALRSAWETHLSEGSEPARSSFFEPYRNCSAGLQRERIARRRKIDINAANRLPMPDQPRPIGRMFFRGVDPPESTKVNRPRRAMASRAACITISAALAERSEESPNISTTRVAACVPDIVIMASNSERPATNRLPASDKFLP